MYRVGLSLVQAMHVSGSAPPETFRPAAAPESSVAVELEQVRRIAFAGVRSGARADAAELRLRDGSVLYGKFVKLTETSLRFDAVDLGVVALQRRKIERLWAARNFAIDVQPRADCHLLVTTRGDTVSGNIEPQPQRWR